MRCCRSRCGIRTESRNSRAASRLGGSRKAYGPALRAGPVPLRAAGQGAGVRRRLPRPPTHRCHHSGQISPGGDIFGSVSWDVNLHPEVEQWFFTLPDDESDGVSDAIDGLAEHGAGLGRPLVDRINGSRYHHMKELRPITAHSRVRILFCPHDPRRR